MVVAALVFAGNNAVGYMTTGGYIQNYATNPEGPLGLDRGPDDVPAFAVGAIVALQPPAYPFATTTWTRSTSAWATGRGPT